MLVLEHILNLRYLVELLLQAACLISLEIVELLRGCVVAEDAHVLLVVLLRLVSLGLEGVLKLVRHVLTMHLSVAAVGQMRVISAVAHA